MTSHAFRASILHYLDDPRLQGESAREYFEDGLLLIENGRIAALGPYSDLIKTLDSHITVEDYSGHLIMPGFIDLHTHYPQTEMIAAYGRQLLEWLNTYTFPTERKFADKDYAKAIATFFVDELLRNGTTTAMVFGTVHKQSVDALFEVAQAQDMRLLAGKVMMDRNAPDFLTDTAQSAYEDSAELIERWHEKGRLHYAVTPRFAPTSTPEQLQKAGQLLQDYPGVYLQSHLAENRDELAWVAALFPNARDYLDAYEQFGLLGPKSIYAHGIHLSEHACQRLADSATVLAHCPTSNLFLGSGLFDMERMHAQGVRFAIGTDVGAGTSFSMFQTLGDAYKIQQLQSVSLAPDQSFYLATLGGARALSLETHLGNFLPGKEADFVVINLKSTPLMAFRTGTCQSLNEVLFVLSMLGDDRLIEATYILGSKAYQREN